MKNNRITENTKEYRSNISVLEFGNKLYIDNQYSEPQSQSKLNYATLTGKWQFEDLSEDYGIKIIQRDTGNSIILSFNSFNDKVTFLKSIYTDKPVKQVGVGFDLEMLANSNVLYPPVNKRDILPEINLGISLQKVYSDILQTLKFEIDNLIKGIDSIIKKLSVIFEK